MMAFSVHSCGALALGAAVLLSPMVPTHAKAQPTTGGGTQSVIGLDLGGEVGGECGGNVPECRSVLSPTLLVDAGQRRLVKLVCGDGSYFWNWSADANAQLVISLFPTQTVKDSQGRETGAIFVLDEQTGTRPGRGQIAIGCSPEDPAGKLGARRTHFSTNPSRRR